MEIAPSMRVSLTRVVIIRRFISFSRAESKSSVWKIAAPKVAEQGVLPFLAR